MIAGNSHAESSALVVGLHFGVGSRYSYLAATQLRALEAETGARFSWLAVNSTRLIAARGYNPFAAPNGAGQYDWSYRQRNAEAWANFYRVPFREPHGRLALDPDPLSLACTAARRLGAAETYAQLLFRAVFVEDLPAMGRALCIERAEKAGLDRDAFTVALDDAGTTTERGRVMHEAAQRGAFGVPTFIVGDQVFWGNDRLALLRNQLLNRV